MLRIACAGLVSLLCVSCSSAPPPPQTKIFDVRVAPVVAQTNLVTVAGVGTVHLRRETALAFTTAGRIARVSVNEGDRVSAGQMLATLDTTNVDAQLDAANAEQARAASELNRSTKLFKQGWVTRTRVDNARAAYRAAVSASRVRQFATSTARIAAPSGGVILARSAEPSQVVDAGTPILVLGEESSGYVLRVPVPDREAARLKDGAAAVVRIASLGNLTVTGFIVQIGGRADPGTGTFEVEISLPQTGGLRSGQIGQAEIVTNDQANGGSLSVPPAAVFAVRAGEGFVYVVPDGSDRAQLRKVTVTDARDGGLIVTKGVSAGEWVVVSGVDRLTDQAKIKPVRTRQ
jgi:RND family efflux transporter MFP subunit